MKKHSNDEASYVADAVSRPDGARVSVYAMIAGLLLLLAWAALADIDQVTRASGQIIAAERTQVIQSADGGVVTELHVKEGDSVSIGQVLATLQKERAQAAVSDSTAKVAALRITLVRLRAEVFGGPLRFDADLNEFGDYVLNQTNLYKRRQAAFNEDIASIRGMLSIAEDELRINKSLLDTGDVSRADVLRLQRSVADLNAQIASRRNKYLQEAMAEMTKAQEELSTQGEQLRDRSQVLEHTELKAPADGIVNNIRATTLGAVLRPGDTVMELLPTGGKLIAEVKVVPTDIAFVEVGQTAFVKLDAYDSTIYGALTGKVSYISPDVLKEETRQGMTSFYRVHVLVDKADIKPGKSTAIQLRPGLTAMVEIKARERSVLSYLTKPVKKTLESSLGER